ncbi:unnamed protein product, partial [Candida parapsilosis]
AHLTH